MIIHSRASGLPRDQAVPGNDGRGELNGFATIREVKSIVKNMQYTEEEQQMLAFYMFGFEVGPGS